MAEVGLLARNDSHFENDEEMEEYDIREQRLARGRDIEGSDIDDFLRAPRWVSRRRVLQLGLGLAMAVVGVQTVKHSGPLNFLAAGVASNKGDDLMIQANQEGKRKIINVPQTKHSSKKQVKEYVESGCHTAEYPEPCFMKVAWAWFRGVHHTDHKTFYGNLTNTSKFTEFQAHLHSNNSAECPRPCSGPGPSRQKVAESLAEAALDEILAPPSSSARTEKEEVDRGDFSGPSGPCLCLFDVDRTLTAKQGSAAHCKGNIDIPGVEDPAYGGGQLTLSPVGARLKETFCGDCNLGIISAGTAGQRPMRETLENHMPGMKNGNWSIFSDVQSSLVFGCGDNFKPQCSQDVVDWFLKERQVKIEPHNVFFFDDHTGNTRGFADRGFNARQVSCASRDHNFANTVGFCGAQLDEIVAERGSINCKEGPEM